VLKWLSQSTSTLKKIAIHIESIENGKRVDAKVLNFCPI